MDHNKSDQIYMGSIIMGAVLMIFSLATDIMWPGIVGVVGFFAGLIQTMFFYRCPHCDHALNTRGPKPKHCPQCGYKLEE